MDEIQKKVEEAEKKVADAQAKLSSIMTAINQENLAIEEKIKKAKEINEDIEKLQFDFDKAVGQTKKAKDEKVVAQDELIEAQKETRKQQGELNYVISRKENAEKDLNDFTENTRKEIEKVNADKALFIKEVEGKKEEISKVIKESEDVRRGILSEITQKETKLEALGKQEEAEIKKLDTLKLEYKDLVLEKGKVEGLLRGLDNKLIDQETIVLKNEIKIDTLDSEIQSKIKEKEKLIAEVEILDKGKSDFIQAKMTLQKDKEELSNRELFIMDKYEQAGLPYRGEMLPTTQNSIKEKADIQQTKEDLDKRELFIKQKYKEAGIDYL